jgi:hypothetical protein
MTQKHWHEMTLAERASDALADPMAPNSLLRQLLREAVGRRKPVIEVKDVPGASLVGFPSDQPVDKTFEQWYGENVSPCFVDEHAGTYHDAHAVFGSDVKAAWDAASATKRESSKDKDLLRRAMHILDVLDNADMPAHDIWPEVLKLRAEYRRRG